jgi:hypothetical protein
MFRRRWIGITAVVVAFVVGFWLGKYFFEPVEENIPSAYFQEMTLLTWKGSSGDLCFLLLPMMQRGRATHDFWSKWSGQCGIPKLKEALSAVPKDQVVYWNDWPGKFDYPEDHLVLKSSRLQKKRESELRRVPHYSDCHVRI